MKIVESVRRFVRNMDCPPCSRRLEGSNTPPHCLREQSFPTQFGVVLFPRSATRSRTRFPQAQTRGRFKHVASIWASSVLPPSRQPLRAPANVTPAPRRPADRSWQKEAFRRLRSGSVFGSMRTARPLRFRRQDVVPDPCLTKRKAQRRAEPRDFRQRLEVPPHDVASRRERSLLAVLVCIG